MKFMNFTSQRSRFARSSEFIRLRLEANKFATTCYSLIQFPMQWEMYFGCCVARSAKDFAHFIRQLARLILLLFQLG